MTVSEITRIKYAGLTPAADTNTYTLFSSVAAFPGGGMMQNAGIKRVLVNIKDVFLGTLKTYKSRDRGVTWIQLDQETVGNRDAPVSIDKDYNIEPYQDWKLDWVNGGTNQTTWQVDIALTTERAASGDQPTRPAKAGQLIEFAQRAVPNLGMAIPITATAINCHKGFWVQAPYENTKPIWIGGSAVSPNFGVELNPGDVIWFDLDDPSQVYAIANAASQTVMGLGY